MPYDTYRLHQIGRAKSSAEVRRADEQAARVASALSSLLLSITRPARAEHKPFPAAPPGLTCWPCAGKAAKDNERNVVPGLA
jgi:hypothetical protein